MDEKLEQIIGWLEARDEADYQAGVLLLQKYGSNRSLVNLLLKKESVANRDKLRYELVKLGCGGRIEDVSEVLNHFAQAIVGAVPVVQQVADVLTGPKFAAEPEPEHVPEEQRAQADELTQLLSKLYNQRCQLSNSLAELDEEEAAGVVGEILRLEQQYNALAQKRRNLANPTQQPAAEGEQPAPEQSEPLTDMDVVQSPVNTVLPLDRAELVKQRGNLRSNISKAKKKAEEAKTEDKRSEYSQKAGKLEVELGLVESQLALPQA
jgi:hypothetical protein